MKNTTTLSLRKRAAVLIALLFLVINNSCKKDLTTHQSFTSYHIGTLLQQLDPKQRISAADILSWIPNLPQEIQDSLRLKKAEQNVVYGRHVIRIPVTNSSSMFFTKENGKMKEYFYRWLDKAPGTKKFTGTILSYSFQDDQLRGLTYQNGKVMMSGQYQGDNYENNQRRVIMSAQLRLMDDDTNEHSFLANYGAR